MDSWIWNEITEPYDFEKQYFAWRERVTKDVATKIGQFLKKENASINDIKKEIKEAVKKGTLHPPKEYIEKVSNQDYLDFFKNYVDVWNQHDSFAYNNLQKILSDVKIDPSLLSTFLENDKNVMTYTLHIPNKIESLAEIIIKISRDSNLVYCPLRTFEHDLLDVCKKYNLCHTELSNLFYFNHDKLRMLFPLNKNRLSLQDGTSMQPFKDFLVEHSSHLSKLRLFFRMIFWSNYDECRRRFFIDFGLIDYLYRKKLFNENKEKLLNKGKTYLNICPQDIV